MVHCCKDANKIPPSCILCHDGERHGSIMINTDGWYMHDRQETRWNLARPRDNIGYICGQSKLFLTEPIPDMGTDTKWFPVVGYEDVSTYDGATAMMDQHLTQHWILKQQGLRTKTSAAKPPVVGAVAQDCRLQQGSKNTP